MSIKPDYKPDAAGNKRRQARFYGLLVITLMLVGAFGSLLAYISSHAPGDHEYAAPVSQPSNLGSQTPAATMSPASTPSTRPKPKYEFYQLLPERQLHVGEEPKRSDAQQAVTRLLANTGSNPGNRVAAPDQPAQPEARQNSGADPPSLVISSAPAVAVAQTPSPNHYVIQVGSYRDQKDADQLKASIAFLGVNAYIETQVEAGRASLHRVRIGPISGAEQVEQVRRRLQQNNIQSIAIKTR